ncbi:MAG: monovalent cation/H(+) antiporter subunit G [Rickettsiales bacterium]|nr:monovalent cation/H(+) antiporter subunit G [Rickettsiales bacterium]
METEVLVLLDHIYSPCLCLGLFFVLLGAVHLLWGKDFSRKSRALLLANIYGVNSLIIALGIFQNESWQILVIIVIINTLISTIMYNNFSRGIAQRRIGRNSRNREKFAQLGWRAKKFIVEPTKNPPLSPGGTGKKINTLEDKNKSAKYNPSPKGGSGLEAGKTGKDLGGRATAEVVAEPKTRVEESKTKVPESGTRTEGPKSVTGQIVKDTSEVKDEPGKEVKAEEDPIKKENDMLTQKIKEQKKILRKKIETARRNAYVTRKPEEIAKTEKIIKDILDKYDLTEESLRDDA